MKIKDRPEFSNKPKPLTCSPDDLVRPTVQKMAEMNYGAVVAVDPNNVVQGMMTERDIMKRVVAEGRDPETLQIKDIMTPDVRVAKEDDDLREWLRMMSNDRFRRLPIVDEHGKLVSIMTQGDFVSYTWPDLINQAVTMTRSTVSSNYQIFLILGAVLLYTIVMGAAITSAIG
ncbi:MAG: CBS domain-containing protein [Pseudomonadota bacterium]